MNVLAPMPEPIVAIKLGTLALTTRAQKTKLKRNILTAPIACQSKMIADEIESQFVSPVDFRL